MKIKREQTWRMFENNWCPVCAEKQDMIRVPTGLPGIAACQCPNCFSNYQANYLEDKEDLLEVPDNFILQTS